MKTLAALAVKACNPNWAISIPTALRVMLISGAKDPIGQNGRGVLKVAEQLELAGIEPTVILYPGARHEILNENDRDMVYKDVLTWAYEAMN
jgi:alpha-beta hydrolase superfamily lysophospholipase